MFATRPYRKFTDDHRAFDDVLRRLMKGADATKSATRSYTSPWDMTKLKALEAENAKLKKLLAEQMMDVSTLKEMLGKNF